MTPLPDNCPPADASPYIGEVYRFVKSMSEEGFKSHFEKFPGRDWGSNLCDAHGLSVCISLDAAHTLRARVKGMAKKKIAVAHLDETSGKVKQTGTEPLHHTWWPSPAVIFASLFRLVEEGSK